MVPYDKCKRCGAFINAVPPRTELCLVCRKLYPWYKEAQKMGYMEKAKDFSATVNPLTSSRPDMKLSVSMSMDEAEVLASLFYSFICGNGAGRSIIERIARAFEHSGVDPRAARGKLRGANMGGVEIIG